MPFQCVSGMSSSVPFLTYNTPSGGFRPSGKGRARSSDPEITGGGGQSQKTFFSALWASVWSKTKGGGPPGPSPRSVTDSSSHSPTSLNLLPCNHHTTTLFGSSTHLLCLYGIELQVERCALCRFLQTPCPGVLSLISYIP